MKSGGENSSEELSSSSSSESKSLKRLGVGYQLIKHEIKSPWKRSEKLNLQILQILYLSFNATVLDEESSPWQTFFLFLFMTKFHPLSPGPLQLQHGSASLSLLDLFVKLRLQLSVGVNWNDIDFNNNVKFSKSLRVLL